MFSFLTTFKLRKFNNNCFLSFTSLLQLSMSKLILFLKCKFSFPKNIPLYQSKNKSFLLWNDSDELD